MWSSEKSTMNIPAARFKAECLQLMDQVEKSRESIIITKHGRAVAQLAPVSSSSGSLFGYMKDTTRTRGDQISPVDEEWSAISGDEDHLYRQSARSRPRKKK
jgi:prevent-host-death family protein